MASEKIDALELDIDAKLNTENLDKLIEKLGELGDALDNLKGKSVKVNIKETGNASEKASSQVDKLTSSFLNQAVKITALIAVYRKLSSVISDGINSSMSYTENLNLFTVSLGEYAENANKYANTVREALGIDPSGWIRTQGVFNTLIEGFGVGAEQAAYMSQNLTQLTYDIASFYNLSISDAEKKIQSAVAGELEPVRRLGYDLSQNALTAIAQNPEYYGKTTYYINQETGAIEANTEALEDNTARVVANFNDLTQGEKVQLRYIALMTQVTEAQGDMARTLNDPANQMRIFKEQTEMTSRALGNAFIPMLNKTMPYVIAFARVLEETFQKIAAYLGYELPDMSDRMNIDDSVGGYEDVEDALEGGAKAAKKIRDYTIGIDELNVLRPDDNTGRGSGSDNQYALGSIYSTPGYDFLGTAIENSINNAKKQIEEFGGYLADNPIGVAVSVFVEGAGAVGEKIWEWILGKSPEELAQDAHDQGISIRQAFINAFVGEQANKSGAVLGAIGVPIWVWLTGKTVDELADEAEKNGTTVGEEFLNAIDKRTSGNAFADTFGKGSETIVSWLFGGEGSSDELGARAAETGNTVGEQFMAEFGRSAMKIIANNPFLAWLYGVQTGRNAEEDLAIFEVKASGATNDKGLKHTYGKADDNATVSPVLGNTSADEARKRGEAQIKSYAKGMHDAIDDVNNAATTIFSSAMNGIDNNGNSATDFFGVSSASVRRYVDGIKGGKNNAYNAGKQLFSSTYTGVTNDGYGNTKYYNTASDNVLNYINGILSGKDNVGNAGSELAKAFTDMLGSQTAKDDSYDAGVEVSRHGALGSWAYKDDFYDAGSNSGSGFIKGIRDWIDEAEEAGKTVGDSVLFSLKLALDEHSPSKKTEQIGRFFTQGYANGILDDMDKATSAVETMAKASIRAANTDFLSDVSVSIPKSNAGYGIGMANEGAMASLASNIYQAVVSGMAAYGNGNGGDTIITIDGREVFRVVQSEARKNGVQISNGAFSR